MFSLIKKSISNHGVVTLGFLMIFLIIMFILPTLVFAQFGQLVPCDGPTTEGPTGKECDYGSLILGVENILNFLIYAGGLIAVGLFVWAGILMVTAAGNTTQIDSAKKIFTNAVLGFIIVLAAWLIVATIVGYFANPEAIDVPLKNPPTNP